jgi:hypothetical protein
MLFNENFDFLWHQLANAQDLNATRRLKDFQRKRLKRALLAAAIRSYFLEANWTNAAGTLGETVVGSTQPTNQDLLVVDGAIRTTDIGASLSADNNNFEIQMIRTGGDSRVQPSTGFIKDEHFLTPAQVAIRNIATALGQGAMWPVTWPVPIYLAPNELLQLTSRVLTGGVPAGEQTFAQFRCVNVNGRNGDDVLAGDLRDWIAAHDLQKPVYLSMESEGFHSIAYPDSTAAAVTTAKTQETNAPLLVIGYSLLFDRDRVSGTTPVAYGTANAKWRLQSSDGWTFSKEEIDCNCFPYAGPQFFWNEFPFPFLLPKGGSLSASFSRRNAPTGAAGLQTTENQDNYVIFRCVTV